MSAAEPRPAHELPDWVDKLYGRRKPADVVDRLIAERRRESHREIPSTLDFFTASD